MSADNGIRIVENEPGLFDVFEWMGDDIGVIIIARKQPLREAIKIGQKHQTEYGISFIFYKPPQTWTDDDLLRKLIKEKGFTIETDNDGQLIIYTDLCEVDGKLENFVSEEHF